MLPNIEPEYREACEGILFGKPRSFSQGWQDWWMAHNIFSQRLTFGDGFYVEMGVWNPTFVSNTLFFDKCLGWRGVCFEPNPQWHALIRRNRSCTLVPHCAFDRNVSVALVKHGQSGGDAFVQPTKAKAHSSRCVVAADALRSLGHANTRIDLLSIDIEGSEPEVIRSCCCPSRFNMCPHA